MTENHDTEVLTPEQLELATGGTGMQEGLKLLSQMLSDYCKARSEISTALARNIR